MRDARRRVLDVLRFAVADRLRHPGDVGAGAEGRARTRDDHRANRARRPRSRRAQSVSSAMTTSLKAFRTSGAVEREPLDGAVTLA